MGILDIGYTIEEIRNDELLKTNGSQSMIAYGDAGYVKFKGGTIIKFNEKAEVPEGTVKNDTKLLLADGVIKVLPAGSVVKFN